MHRPMQQQVFTTTSLPYLNNFMARIIIARMNNKIDSLLIKCIFFTNDEFGLLGSFFFRYKYSAIWLSTLMMLNYAVKLIFKLKFLIFVKAFSVLNLKKLNLRN